MKLSSLLVASVLAAMTLSGCGGGDSNEVQSGSGGSGGSVASGSSATGGTAAGGGTTNARICSGDDLKGDWRITLTVGALTESDVVAFDGTESPGSNVINATRDGITVMGTINPSCDSISGTATNGALSGNFTGVKIS